MIPYLSHHAIPERLSSCIPVQANGGLQSAEYTPISPGFHQMLRYTRPHPPDPVGEALGICGETNERRGEGSRLVSQQHRETCDSRLQILKPTPGWSRHWNTQPPRCRRVR